MIEQQIDHLQKRVKELEAQAEIDNKGNQEWIDDLCKQLCQMEGALGFKEDQYDKQGQWVPIIGPWLERVRDLIAAEGELGDLRQRVKELEAENGKLRNPCMGVVVITEEAYAELQQLRAEHSRAIRQLSSGLCSAHSPPDPLNCDTCNQLKWITGANDQLRAERDELRRENGALLSGLENAATALVSYGKDCRATVAEATRKLVNHVKAKADATPGSPAL